VPFPVHIHRSQKVIYLGWPLSRRDRNIVAEATIGAGWSTEYHESPDYQASLMILPIRDDSLATFVISPLALRFRLAACQDDLIYQLGVFQTLSETVTALRRSMADQRERRFGEDRSGHAARRDGVAHGPQG
jgi:hypothetical protein